VKYSVTYIIRTNMPIKTTLYLNKRYKINSNRIIFHKTKKLTTKIIMGSKDGEEFKIEVAEQL
jgi:hypothetical protein